MVSSDSGNTINVGPDEYPHYNGNEPVITQSTDGASKNTGIQQGQGSSLNSDTVDGWQVSTATHPSPNTLIPVGPDGKLPASIIPSSGAVDTVARMLSLLAASEII